MPKLSQDALREISQSKPNSRERKKLIRIAGYLSGMSEASVYRAVQKYEHRKKSIRIQEADIETARKILALKQASRGLKHQRISTEMAIEEAIKRGFVPVDAKKINRARIDEIARLLGTDEKHQRMAGPCVRLVTPGPNTWSQADFTVAQCFYLKNMRVHFRNIFHSKKEPKQKIILGTYVEMYSSCKFWFAFEALGENTLIATDFLYRAFEKKGADFPLYGLPYNLYVDQGSPFKSGHFKTLLTRLGINLHQHMPSNARATGMAEKSFQQVQKLEALIKTRVHEKDWPSLDDFNRWLFELAVDENNKVRRGDDKARFEKWLEIHPEDLRCCPPREIFMNLTAAHENKRKVHPDLCIYHGGRIYWVGESNLCGEEVDAFVNVDGKIWIYHPLVGYKGPLEEGVKANILGQDFERPQLTWWQKERNELRRIAQEHGIGKAGPGQYYSRSTEKLHKVPQSRDALAGQEEAKQEISINEAKLRISEQIGIPLGQLPSSTQALIQEILDSQSKASETDGAVPGEIIEEICERIKEIMKVSEEGDGT